MAEGGATEQTPCGIDLGSSNTYISVFEKGNAHPTFIKTQNQENFHGSYVYYSESSQEKPIFGTEALAMLPSENVVRLIKRAIGVTANNISDPSIFNAKVANVGKKRYIEFNLKIDGKIVVKAAKEIMTDFMKHYKDLVISSIPGKIGFVVSQPQYWNSAQNTAFKECLRNAGIVPLKVLTEPTAALCAYRAKTGGEIGKEKTCITDLGAGTFDSVLQEDLGEGKYRTYCVGGDDQLGSSDVDEIFLRTLQDDLKKEPGYNEEVFKQMVPENRQKMRNMKHMLSTLPKVSQIIPGITAKPFTFIMTRERKGEILKEFYLKVEKVLDDMFERLAESSKGKYTVDDIINSVQKVAMVGGGMKDRHYGDVLLPRKFPKAKIVGKPNSGDGIDPDQAVSTGCAYWAASLIKTPNIQGLPPNPVNQIVLSKSLGVETVSNYGEPNEQRWFSKIVCSNTPIPTIVKDDRFSTCRDNQPKVTIEVHQGEGRFTTEKGVTCIGSYDVEIDTPNVAFEPKIEIEMDVGDDNILVVRAGEKGKSKKELTICEEL